MNRSFREDEPETVPAPGVVETFPVGDGGPPFQVGYGPGGVWLGRPNLCTTTIVDSDALRRAVDTASQAHQLWFCGDATVVRLAPHRSS